jgi:hypothetical protein
MYMDKKKEREIGTFDREDKKPIPVSPYPLPGADKGRYFLFAPGTGVGFPLLGG